MSDVLYDAHPSMIRIHPFTTLLALTLIPLGIAFALMGGSLLPMAAPVVGVVGLGVAAVAFLTLLIWYVRTKTDLLGEFQRLTADNTAISDALRSLHKQHEALQRDKFLLATELSRLASPRQ